jgi:hypothetical protein
VSRNSFLDHPHSMASFPAKDGRDDYLSNYELHKPRQAAELRNTEEYMGLSMWRTKEVAIEQWRLLSTLQRFKGLAPVILSRAKGMWYWEDPDTGHLVVWATPKDLSAATGKVIPLEN